MNVMYEFMIISTAFCMLIYKIFTVDIPKEEIKS
jgi:hypothetical protein